MSNPENCKRAKAIIIKAENMQLERTKALQIWVIAMNGSVRSIVAEVKMSIASKGAER